MQDRLRPPQGGPGLIQVAPLKLDLAHRQQGGHVLTGQDVPSGRGQDSAARSGGLLESALKPAHFCLSAQIAEPLAAAGARTIHVAQRPLEAALIELLHQMQS